MTSSTVIDRTEWHRISESERREWQARLRANGLGLHDVQAIEPTDSGWRAVAIHRNSESRAHLVPDCEKPLLERIHDGPTSLCVLSVQI